MNAARAESLGWFVDLLLVAATAMAWVDSFVAAGVEPL
jgi:hypothetical protein